MSAVLTKKSRHQPTSLQARMPANNTQGRAAKRNTQGGKAFKSQKKGDEGFRARAAREAAEEMLDLILRREKVGLADMKPEDVRALLEIQVGRVSKKFGNGRFEVLCQDNVMRNCALRGLLKRKGQTHVDTGDIIVVALSEPLEEMESSDDEGHFGGGAARAGAAYRSAADQGFVVGIFNAAATAALRKTHINPRLFHVEGDAMGLDDLFDRSAGGAADEEAAAGGAGARAAVRKAKKGEKAAADDINIDDL